MDTDWRKSGLFSALCLLAAVSAFYCHIFRLCLLDDLAMGSGLSSIFAYIGQWEGGSMCVCVTLVLVWRLSSRIDTDMTLIRLYGGEASGSRDFSLSSAGQISPCMTGSCFSNTEGCVKTISHLFPRLFKAQQKAVCCDCCSALRSTVMGRSCTAFIYTTQIGGGHPHKARTRLASSIAKQSGPTPRGDVLLRVDSYGV
jgi:hypothetical protein